MIEANAAIFSSLDNAVSKAGQRVPNTGAARWICTDPSERIFLKEAKIRNSVKIGAIRQVLHIEHQDCSYFATVGFSEEFDTPHLEMIDANSSHLTVTLFEGAVEPYSRPLEIIQNIGGQDRESDSTYIGHSKELIAPLFPQVRMFKKTNGVVDDFWQAYFMICIEEAVATGSWLSKDLSQSLQAMSELDSAKIPYSVLCRSIFDHDRSSLFLALYRCLEALYSYSATVSLISNLGIEKDWKSVSKQLEADLRWYPKEDTALQGLFKNVGLKELTDISAATAVALEPVDTLSVRVARAVYDIRNRSVHFRPYHQDTDFDSLDWDRLCIAMSCVVLDVYNECS